MGRASRGPISFFFMQFLAKILPNNRLLPQTQGLTPIVLEILGVPLATVHKDYLIGVEVNIFCMVTVLCWQLWMLGCSYPPQ